MKRIGLSICCEHTSRTGS